MEYHYEVYGLQLRSTEPLRGLLLGQPGQASDLDVIWCRDESEQLASGAWVVLANAQQPGSVTPVTLWRSDSAGGELLKLRYSIDNCCCDFVFDQQERTLRVFFPGTITRGRLRGYLLGSVLSSILRLRGTICLHASVVALDHQAIAFAARKGEGKSTIAAALAKRGARVLSDDIAAITRHDGRFMVHPGEMDIRLLQPSVGALYGGHENSGAPTAPPGVDGKVRVRLDTEGSAFGNFSAQALPLAAIYLFENSSLPSSPPAISLVRSGDRYMALFQHLYGFWLDKGSTHAHDFRTLAELANTLPLYKINRPRELDQLSLVCEAIKRSLSDQNERELWKPVLV